jgi:hypothetical protein
MVVGWICSSVVEYTHNTRVGSPAPQKIKENKMAK